MRCFFPNILSYFTFIINKYLIETCNKRTREESLSSGTIIQNHSRRIHCSIFEFGQTTIESKRNDPPNKARLVEVK